MGTVGEWCGSPAVAITEPEPSTIDTARKSSSAASALATVAAAAVTSPVGGSAARSSAVSPPRRAACSSSARPAAAAPACRAVAPGSWTSPAPRVAAAAVAPQPSRMTPATIGATAIASRRPVIAERLLPVNRRIAARMRAVSAICHRRARSGLSSGVSRVDRSRMFSIASRSCRTGRTTPNHRRVWHTAPTSTSVAASGRFALRPATPASSTASSARGPPLTPAGKRGCGNGDFRSSGVISGEPGMLNAHVLSTAARCAGETGAKPSAALCPGAPRGGCMFGIRDRTSPNVAVHVCQTATSVRLFGGHDKAMSLVRVDRVTDDYCSSVSSEETSDRAERRE